MIDRLLNNENIKHLQPYYKSFVAQAKQISNIEILLEQNLDLTSAVP